MELELNKATEYFNGDNKDHRNFLDNSDEFDSIVSAQFAGQSSSIIKQPPKMNKNVWEIDVPGDDSCLFWAVALAFLLPVLEEDKKFQDRYIKLFGNLNHLQYVQEILKKYNPFSDTSIFLDNAMNKLIREEFRARVIGIMADETHKETFRLYYDGSGTFEDYLTNMQRTSSWAGELEIRAMSMLLECNIHCQQGDLTQCYPDLVNEDKPIVQIVYVNYLGRVDKEAKKNHYHFNISKDLTEKYQICNFNAMHLFDLKDTFTCEIFKPNQISALKDIFEQVLVSEILLEVKYHQYRSQESKALKHLQLLLSLSSTGAALSERKLDFKLLRIHLQIFAKFASLRYEPFIAKCLSYYPLLGVIPLARVGARRLLEFLDRMMEFYTDESIMQQRFYRVLLKGLVEGGPVKDRYQSQPMHVRGLFSKNEAKVDYTPDEILSFGEIFEESIIGYNITDKTVHTKKDDQTNYRYTKIKAYFPAQSYRSVVYFSTFEDLCTYSDYYAGSLKKIDKPTKSRQRSSSDGEKSISVSTIDSKSDQPLTFYEWIKREKSLKNENSVWVVNLNVNKKSHESSTSLCKFIVDCYQSNGVTKRKKYIYGNFTNIRMDEIDFRGCTFKKVVFLNTDCQLINAQDVVFRDVNIIETRLDCSKFDRAKLLNCNVSKSSWYHTSTDHIDYSESGYIEREIKISQTDEDDVLSHLLIPNQDDLTAQFSISLSDAYGFIDKNAAINVKSFHYFKYLDLEYFKLYTAKIKSNLLIIQERYAHRFGQAAAKKLKVMIDKTNRILKLIIQVQQQVLQDFHLMPTLDNFHNAAGKEFRLQDIDTLALIDELNLLRKEIFKWDQPKVVRGRFFNSSINKDSDDASDNLQFFTRSGTLLHRSLRANSRVLLTRSSFGVGNDQAQVRRPSGSMARHPSLTENLLDDTDENLLVPEFDSDSGAHNELYLSQIRCSRDRMLHAALEKALSKIKSSMERERENGHPSCYISYIHQNDINEKDENEMIFFLRGLRDHLRLAGIKAMLNIVDNRTAYKSEDYINQILAVDFVLLICTKSTVCILQNKDTISRHSELRLIEERKKTTKKEILTIAVMEKDELFAVDNIGLTCLNNIIYWHKDTYLKYLGDLIAYLWGINKSHKIMKKYWLPLRDIGAFRSSDTLQKSNRSHENDSSPLNTSPGINDVDSDLYSKFVNTIKEKYRYDNEKQSSTYEFNETYFDLTLVRLKDEKLESLSNVAPRTAVGSQEGTMSDSRSMPSNYITSLDSIFLETVNENDYHKRILIQGKPGVGKSTLLKYIAYNWACNAGADRLGLWCDQFDLVLLINLHKLRSYPDDKCDIEHVIFDELLSSNSKWSLEDITKILMTQPHKILLLLDGFDEVEAVYQESSPQGRLFHSLIDLERCSTVITSRLDSVRLINSVFDEVIEIVGFSKEEINRFVQRAMKRVNFPVTTEEELIRMIDLNPHIAAISHVPVNLGLICEFWIQKGPKDPITMTQFFDAINNWLQEQANIKFSSDRDLTKTTSLNTIVSNKLKLAEFLKILAWKCIPLPTTMMNEELIVGSLAEYNINIDYFRTVTQRLLAIGLLNCVRQDNFRRRVFYFPHRTFLEYYASLFWLSLFMSEEKRDVALGMLKQNIDNPKYEVVWQFVSGHLENMRQVELQKLFFEQLLSYRGNEELTDSNYFRIALLLLCYEEAKISVNDRELDIKIKFKAKQTLHSLLDEIDASSNEKVRKLVFTWKSCNRLFNSEFIVDEIRLVLQDTNNFKQKMAMLTLLSLVGDFNIEILSLLISITGTANEINADICSIISKYFIKKQKYVTQKEIGVELFQYMLNMLKSENDVLRGLSLEWLSDLVWWLLPAKYHEIAFSILYEEYLRRSDKAIINAISEIDLKKISELEKTKLFNQICSNIFKESTQPKRSSRAGKVISFEIIEIFIPKLSVANRLEFISISLMIFKSDKPQSPKDVLKIIYYLFRNASYEINNESIINEVIKELCKVKDSQLLTQVYTIFNILLGYEFRSELHNNILEIISGTIMSSSQKDKKKLIKVLGKLYLKSKDVNIKNKIIEIIISLFDTKNINTYIKIVLLTLIRISDQLSSNHVQKLVPKLTKYCTDIDQSTVKITFNLLCRMLQESKDHNLINLLVDVLKDRIHHANSSIRLTIVTSLNIGYSHSIDEILSNKLAIILIDMLNDSSNDVIIAALNGLQNLNILFLKVELRDKYVTEVIRMWNHQDFQIKEKISCILNNIEWAKMPVEITVLFQKAKNENSQSASTSLNLEKSLTELARIEELLSIIPRSDNNDELKSLILNMEIFESLYTEKILKLLAMYLNKHLDPLPQDIIKLIASFNSGVLVELIDETNLAKDYAKLLYWLCRSKNLLMFKKDGVWNFMNESEEKIVLPATMTDALNELSEEIKEVVAPKKAGTEPKVDVQEKEGCKIL